jgi:hypothetical protein
MHTGNTVKFTDFHDNFSTWQLSFINSAAEASLADPVASLIELKTQLF